MKTTTVLIEDVRVSWFNVNCVHYQPADDGFMFTIFWKYKAAIKRENIFTPMKANELSKYFEKFGLVKYQDYYVNLSKIMLIKEDPVYGPQDKTRVQLIFNDGFNIMKVLPSEEWSWWKQSYV